MKGPSMTDTAAADPIVVLGRPEVRRDPALGHAELRKGPPVFWHEGLATWMLTRHADAVAVLRDSEAFACDWRRLGEELPAQAVSVQTLDPPEHTAVRRLLLEGFRAADYPAMERLIAEQALDRLHRLASRPSVDFVAELAEPLALATMAEFLGVPEPDPEWLVPVSDAIVDGMDAGVWPELAEPAMTARAELAAYTERWLADPPQRGLIGFVAPRAAESGVDRAVLSNTFRVLLHAGYTSASKLLGLAAVTLLESGALAAFRAVNAAVATEELVRYESPVQAVARACVADTELGGVTMRAGQVVTVLVGAANRDPARFAAPDELRLDRAPNPHLGFGRGAHSCLGGPLAALQARVLFTALAERYPATRAVTEPVYRQNLTLRGLRRLPVELR